MRIRLRKLKPDPNTNVSESGFKSSDPFFLNSDSITKKNLKKKPFVQNYITSNADPAEKFNLAGKSIFYIDPVQKFRIYF